MQQEPSFVTMMQYLHMLDITSQVIYVKEPSKQSGCSLLSSFSLINGRENCLHTGVLVGGSTHGYLFI